MPATASWLAAAESVLNRSIAASSRAGALARRLDGTSIQVSIDGWTSVRACVNHERLALLDAAEAPGVEAPGVDTPPDARISGSAPALLRMMQGRTPSPSDMAVQVSGDAETANRYRELFAAARPDWEEELSRHIGDLPARGVMRAAGRLSAWAAGARRTLGQNIAEYLQEESRDLVSRTEADEFLQGVDDVRDHAERIAARLERLEARAKDAP